MNSHASTLDIRNSTSVMNLLEGLKESSPPLFGIMTPQHMVEHVILLLRISNGTLESKMYYDDIKSGKVKSIVIYSERAMPVGFKSPALPTEGLMPLEFENLSVACQALIEELEKMFGYFEVNPGVMPVNPTMGPLNANEWEIFHRKHFTHHFKQFALIE